MSHTGLIPCDKDCLVFCIASFVFFFHGKIMELFNPVIH